MEKSLSFVIPVYNAEKYIGACIESILKQKNLLWELIIVNDGSTDETAEICNRYAEQDERINVIHQKNSGVVMAREIGLNAAKGEWISFIDGDDWIETNYVETLKPYMEEKFDFIIFSYYMAYKTKRKSMCQSSANILLNKEKFELLVKDSIDTEKRVKGVAASRAQIYTKIYRKSFLVENNIYADKGLHILEDVMFNLRVYQNASNAIFIPKPLYNYRMLEESVSHQYSSKHTLRVLESMQAIERYVVENELDNGNEYLYQKRILVSLVYICKNVLCHKLNSAGFFYRRKIFVQLCEQEPFCSALNRTVICCFTFKKQLCMWLIKFKCFGLLDIILKSI